MKVKDLSGILDIPEGLVTDPIYAYTAESNPIRQAETEQAQELLSKIAAQMTDQFLREILIPQQASAKTIDGTFRPVAPDSAQIEAPRDSNQAAD
jgi:hypothetical protein